MKIKIDHKNNEAINAALEKVNGRAESFTVSCTKQLVLIAEKAERKLDILPKGQRKDATARFIPAGPSARAYKYPAKSTQVMIERGSTGWFLVGIQPHHVHPTRLEVLSVTISQLQAEEIQRRAIAGFVVNPTSV
jgi:hypothetical protein